MLTTLKLRDFRCFSSWEGEFAPGCTAIVGPNARGKTSLLEAACVMLRLQTPRSATLGPLIRVGGVGFVIDGYYANRHMQFYFSARRKKLALDSVEQKTAAQYLEVGRVVWFSNSDIALVRESASERRRYLDFVAAQIDPTYRQRLRAYERALKARNFLLKATPIRWREIAAFDEPLMAAGNALTEVRSKLVAALGPLAAEAHRAISGQAGEVLAMRYLPGAEDDFAMALADSREESARLRQTVVGPHRDEVKLVLNGLPASMGSEGQQRTVVLALRLAQAQLIARQTRQLPLLLLDDVFGELDKARRNALMARLPPGAQRIVTTTNLDWAEGSVDRLIRL